MQGSEHALSTTVKTNIQMEENGLGFILIQNGPYLQISGLVEKSAAAKDGKLRPGERANVIFLKKNLSLLKPNHLIYSPNLHPASLLWERVLRLAYQHDKLGKWPEIVTKECKIEGVRGRWMNGAEQGGEALRLWNVGHPGPVLIESSPQWRLSKGGGVHLCQHSRFCATLKACKTWEIGRCLHNCYWILHIFLLVNPAGMVAAKGPG